MTNFSLERMLASEGIALTRVAVGDRLFSRRCSQRRCDWRRAVRAHHLFGFPIVGRRPVDDVESGGSDGRRKVSFDDLTHDWMPSPQLLKGVRVKQKVPIENMPALQAKMTEVIMSCKDRGRMVVRYSGTEPLLRVMIESDDADSNERLMDDMLEAIATASLKLERDAAIFAITR